MFPGNQPDWLVEDARHVDLPRGGTESHFRVRKANGHRVQVREFHVEAAIAGGARVV